MILKDLLTLVRGQLDDQKGEGTPLWSDKELVGYANEVQERIADECLVIRDATTITDGVCRIAVTKNVASYPLHPKTKQVLRVKYAGRSTPLDLISYEEIIETATGIPTAYALDKATLTLTLNKIPQADATMDLVIARLPLEELSASAQTASPEIPSSYHRKMINGIMALAYMKQDAETFNPTKAEYYDAKFAQDIEQIKRDELRLRRRGTTCLRRIW